MINCFRVIIKLNLPIQEDEGDRNFLSKTKFLELSIIIIIRGKIKAKLQIMDEGILQKLSAISNIDLYQAITSKFQVLEQWHQEGLQYTGFSKLCIDSVFSARNLISFERIRLSDEQLEITMSQITRKHFQRSSFSTFLEFISVSCKFHCLYIV